MEKVVFIILFAGFSLGFEYKEKQLKYAYDYIVVGAGSSGAVVANRLAENGNYSVLLLEAGGFPPPVSEVPIYTHKTMASDVEWTTPMEVQEGACQAQRQGRCWTSRAKVLGGCSTHNFMIFNRGNRKDYDNWEKLGAKGWNYQSVLKVFKQVENHTDSRINRNGYHGTDGLQTVSPLAFTTRLGAAYIEGGRQLGHAILTDYNGRSQTGFSYTQVSQRRGLRCSTEKAFLRPAADWPNLHILTRAYVLKINFDRMKRVRGVLFDHKNITREVKVRKEVVLSAGAVSSPTILMHSGIGPKDHLMKMNIPVVVDLPGVGQNLQDHPWVSFVNYKINDSAGIVFDRDINPDTIGLLTEGKGPLTSPAFSEITAHYNTKYQGKEDWPDIMFHSGMAAIYPVANTSFSDVNSTGFIMTITRHKSRGFIQLRSPNPYDDPVVNPQYFSDVEDLYRLREGVKVIMDLMKTPPLQRFDPQITPKILPGCEQFDPKSDLYIECGVEKYIGGGYHLAGTCRMGDPKDNTTVVDSFLRVLGVQGLRVADASIMPEITTGNLNAPCIMIGRMVADKILTGA